MGLRELTVPASGAPDVLPESGELSVRQCALARRRLRQLAFVLCIIQVVDSTVWVLTRSLYQNPLMMHDLVVMNIAAVALDLSLFAIAIDTRFSDRAVIHWFYLEHLLRCAILASSPMHFGDMLGLSPPTMTYVCPAIITFRILVPLPRSSQLVTLLAAATQPLATAFVPMHPVSSWALAGSVVTATVAASFALLGGRMTYGLTTAASRQELGPYRLIDKIGQGEYGEVWRAKHRLLARAAAIKTIRATELSRDAGGTLLRFEREAQITASLSSPHTVTVYDYGMSEEGVVYYAMELLDGTDYESYVREQGPLPPERVLRVALEVCDSLAEAHSRGLVHRDLKPANLFRARIGLRDDFTVVLDFGLAALRSHMKGGRPSRGEVASSLRVAGTPAYLPPELLLGGPYDTRADIYQLGCVMHFMLTGRLLFESTSKQSTVREHLRRPVPSLRDKSPFAIPDELEIIVARCLEKDPERRYSDVQELEAALGNVARSLDVENVPDHRPVRARPVRPSEAKAPPKRPKVKAKKPSAHFARKLAPAAPSSLPTRLRRAYERKLALTPELVSAARGRLGQAGYLATGLTAVLTPLWLFLQPVVVRERILAEVVLSTGCLMSLHLCLLLAVSDKNLSSRGVLRVGIGYFVLTTFVLAFGATRMSELSGEDLPRMGLPILTVILLPIFVPLGLRKLIVPILLMGAAQPLAQVLFGSTDAVAQVLGDSISNALTSTLAAIVLGYLVTQQTESAATRRVFGAYTLSKKIGQGAMGEVWEAKHDHLARPAAIKLLREGAPEKKDPERLLRRFEREAQLTASLTSPHTVTLYDYGVSNEEELYYVMELLRGRDLQRTVTEDGPFTPDEAIRVILPACESVEEAHTRGLVHRDLKPENIFCAHVGRQPDFIKVLDFGLARRELSSDLSLSSHVAWVGTPAYMAPETFLVGSTSAQSDLYSLGCILFFLLTGRPPYERNSVPALALAHAQAPIPHVSEHMDQPIPYALESIVLRCLEKDPAQRFESVLELRAALLGVLAQYLRAPRAPGPEALPPSVH